MQIANRKSTTKNSKETQEIAQELVEQIIKQGPRDRAVVVTLAGELGAGKTTFVQGFTRALGIEQQPTSPTFLIMRRYPIDGGDFMNVYHIDAYRVKSSDELTKLGFAEIVADPRAIILIEWPERIADLIPADAIAVSFTHGTSEGERTIIL